MTLVNRSIDRSSEWMIKERLPAIGPRGYRCFFTIYCSFDWLVGWLIDWLNDWLTDWLIDWLVDCCVIDRLTADPHLVSLSFRFRQTTCGLSLWVSICCSGWAPRHWGPTLSTSPFRAQLTARLRHADSLPVNTSALLCRVNSRSILSARSPSDPWPIRKMNPVSSVL